MKDSFVRPRVSIMTYIFYKFLCTIYTLLYKELFQQCILEILGNIDIVHVSFNRRKIIFLYIHFLCNFKDCLKLFLKQGGHK